MERDDILFDDELEGTSNDSGIELDLNDDGVNDVTPEVKETSEDVKEPIQTEEVPSTTEDEDIDLDALFAEIDDANDALDKIEANKGGDNSEDIGVLKDSLSKMEQIVKRLTNEKADLTYRVADLEAFGADGSDPKILLLSRNLTKAKDGDDKAKTKALSILKDMLYDLTGEDYEQSKIDKDVDLLSAVEQYNNTTNPNLKASKKEVNNTLDVY